MGAPYISAGGTYRSVMRAEKRAGIVRALRRGDSLREILENIKTDGPNVHKIAEEEGLTVRLERWEGGIVKPPGGF